MEGDGVVKSTDIQLRKRGKASEKDIQSLHSIEAEQRIQMLSHQDAWTRSAAALSLKRHADQAASALLQQLEKERCLYTRIALCEALEAGGVQTAEKMAAYLGRIGTNQYKEVPDTVSAKTSYPLPRDIIARSMGRMDCTILPVLLDVMKSGCRSMVSEALDAVGFMIFYHPEIAVSKTYGFFCELGETWRTDSLIMWKLLLCLSAFSCEECTALLQEYANQSGVLKKQAERSLHIIRERNRRRKQ